MSASIRPPSPPPSKLPYVVLKDWPETSSWSNDPKSFQLETYFCLEPPNLSTDYNVVGLKPVLTEKDGDDWLLTDAAGLYYMWNIWDNSLWRFEKGITQAQALERVTEGEVRQSLTEIFIYRGPQSSSADGG